MSSMFRNLLEWLDRMTAEAEEKKSGEKDSSVDIGGIMGEYGMHVHTVSGNTIFEKSKVFGEEGSEPESTATKKPREPQLDVLEGEKHIRVVVEVPGIKKEDIEFAVEDRTLDLDASGEERSFRKTVELPSPVEMPPVEMTYNNGVLTLSFARRREDETNAG